MPNWIVWTAYMHKKHLALNKFTIVDMPWNQTKPNQTKPNQIKQHQTDAKVSFIFFYTKHGVSGVLNTLTVSTVKVLS